MPGDQVICSGHQVVTPIADLGRTFGQREMRPLVSWSAHRSCSFVLSRGSVRRHRALPPGESGRRRGYIQRVKQCLQRCPQRRVQTVQGISAAINRRVFSPGAPARLANAQARFGQRAHGGRILCRIGIGGRAVAHAPDDALQDAGELEEIVGRVIVRVGRLLAAGAAAIHGRVFVHAGNAHAP